MPEITDVIANRLSIIFGGPHMSPCGCMGVPPCTNTGCAYWWEIVMRDEEIREKAIQFYQNNKEQIETGVVKILSHRFLI